MSDRRPTIGIVSESASDNLGDAAIYESIRSFLSPFCDVVPVPLTTPSRSSSGSGASKPRARGRMFLPPRTRAQIKWYMLGGRKAQRRKYERYISEVDAVIIGGGQLLKSNIALFPERIHEICRICTSQSKKVGFFGVGVDSNPDKISRIIFDNSVRISDYFGVRDDISKTNLSRFTQDHKKIATHADPAFLISRSPEAASHGISDNLILINVMSFRVFASRKLDSDDINHDNYIETLTRLYSLFKDTHDVEIFTTGDQADLADAQHVSDSAHRLTGARPIVHHPHDLDGLFALIGRARHVIASRMHAGIIARALGANVVCADWDSKIEGCWTRIGEGDRVFRGSLLNQPQSAEQIAGHLFGFTGGELPDDARADIEAGLRTCLNAITA